MATLPSATLTIDDTSGAFAGGTGYVAVFAPVGTNADMTPRVFASAAALLDEHNYSQGADYVAHHIEETGLPVIFVGLPIATAGTVGRINSTGVTGNSAISVAAGGAGYLEETDASLEVVDGGTVGTDQITFDLSLDGGRTTKRIRLGTASSYTIPYVGITLNFGAGTLVAGDLYTFTTTAPMWDSTGLAAARTALAAQQKQVRSIVVIGDVANSTFAGYVTTQVNAYETANDRYVYARVNVRDRLPLASMSKATKRATGTFTMTFVASGHTATRSAGSFLTDGFAVGDTMSFTGTASNNVSLKITSLSGTVATFASGLSDEGPVSSVAVTGSPTITFAEVGSTGDTITRSSGSWLDDGFAVGDNFTVAGTASNNITTTNGIAGVTATVITLGTDDLAAEAIRSDLISITKGETMSAWISAMDAAFASVDGQKRIDIAAGRARKQSPITAWEFRRPAMWALSTREYQHDLQIPNWRKSDGPLLDWDITDGNGNVVEYDERTVGGALAARFSCLRTYSNGPEGAFSALSLTRDTEGSLLSRTHNMAVADLACTITQAETENAIGQVLVLNSDGTGTTASLQQIEERVNTQLQINLLQAGVEGQRASLAVWTASKTDVLNVTDATLTGSLALELNGTLEHIATAVNVQTAG